MSPSNPQDAWRQIGVATTRTALAEAVFEQFEAEAISILDAGDDVVIEPSPHTQPAFARSRVVGLFAAQVATEPVTHALRAVLGPDAVIDIDGLDQRDWARAWLAHHPPLYFGTRLCVAPHGTPVEAGGDELRIVRLDPGLAFGTGTHPTTALCLTWLAGADLAGCSVLDYGCGSGILAIAAALLGAAQVTAVDTDPQAVRATRDNARANGVADDIATPAIDQLATRHHDIVLANILARPLLDLAPTLINHVGPGGKLVLSGLLQRHIGQIEAAYSPLIRFAQPAQQDGWVRLDGQHMAQDRV